MKPYRDKLTSERLRSAFPERPADTLTPEAHVARRERVISHVQLLLETEQQPPKQERNIILRVLKRLLK